jgi:uncharacterized protein YbcI
MHQTDERPAGGSAAAAISDTVVRLMSEYTGRGPTKAKTVIGRDVITVLLQDTLTKGERRLADAGKAEIVLRMRQEFQRTMREDLVTATEMILERKVIAFMSDNHIEPDMAAEVFVLAPQDGIPRTTTPAEAELGAVAQR